MRLDIDGKYTVVFEDSKLSALRYGEVWRSLVGDNLVLALALELQDARLEIEQLREVEKE